MGLSQLPGSVGSPNRHKLFAEENPYLLLKSELTLLGPPGTSLSASLRPQAYRELFATPRVSYACMSLITNSFQQDKPTVM